jgi:hypothetical protein
MWDKYRDLSYIWRDHLEGLGVDGRILKWVPRNWVWGRGLRSSSSGSGTQAEWWHNDKPSDSIKSIKFLDQLSNYQPLNNSSSNSYIFPLFLLPLLRLLQHLRIWTFGLFKFRINFWNHRSKGKFVGLPAREIGSSQCLYLHRATQTQ